MKCYIGLGSNLGDRKANLENSARSLVKSKEVKLLRVSPIVESPALVPENSPATWRKSFFNAVLEIDWSGSPTELLHCLKEIELQVGRDAAAKWAPRIVDLDLLVFGDLVIHEENLRVPHAGIANRQFVLAPLKHLSPSLKLPDFTKSVLTCSRELHNPLPLWMGILNLTPDSFSDGNTLHTTEVLNQQLDAYMQDHVHILDLGAESTRPGATPISTEEEMTRLRPALELLQQKTEGHIFRPHISIDTYHPETAAWALDKGAGIINDVSGLRSPAMLELLKRSTCEYILMHSLTVPADPQIKMAIENPVQAVKDWAERKLEQLQSAGINLDRIIFDPGIGFGKSPAHSLLLLEQIHQFMDLPVRVLVGHSRKSFLNHWGLREASARDAETLGISLKLANKGVDILRVHTPDLHQRAFRAFREV